MKRLFSVLIIMVMMLSFASCNEEKRRVIPKKAPYVDGAVTDDTPSDKSDTGTDEDSKEAVEAEEERTSEEKITLMHDALVKKKADGVYSDKYEMNINDNKFYVYIDEENKINCEFSIVFVEYDYSDHHNIKREVTGNANGKLVIDEESGRIEVKSTHSYYSDGATYTLRGDIDIANLDFSAPEVDTLTVISPQGGFQSVEREREERAQLNSVVKSSLSPMYFALVEVDEIYDTKE